MQVRDIVADPDNLPIIGVAVAMPFYAWYGWRQARATDRLVARLEGQSDHAPAGPRKPHPFEAGWEPTVSVWPYLLRIEFLAAMVVTALLLAWSMLLDAPLGAPANPNATMNPAKAPWYFVGLQEMLVYFDPWFAGVVLPALIILGLMLFPYLDANPLGSGYYTMRQRRVALGAFGAGLIIWLGAIVVGTFVRGPGWMWFWPGQTWDHTRVIYEVDRNLPDVLGVHGAWAQAAVGIAAIAIFYAAAGWAIHRLVTWSAFDRKVYARTGRLQYAVFQALAITLLAGLPAKVLLRLLFRVKYVLITPWFKV
jgi:hypothetical protein